MDFTRVNRTDLVGLGGGLLLALSLWLPWFGVGAGSSLGGAAGPTSRSAWGTFNVLDFLLLAGASAPFILTWIVVRRHQLSWPPGEMTAIVGLVAITLIVYNGVIDRAGPGLGITLKPGWFVALVGAVAIFLGGAMRAAEKGRPRKPPGQF